MKYISEAYYLSLSEITSATGYQKDVVVTRLALGRKTWQGIKDPDDGRVLLVSYATLSGANKARVLEWIGRTIGVDAAAGEEDTVLSAYLAHCNVRDGLVLIGNLISSLEVSSSDKAYFRAVANHTGACPYTDAQIGSLALAAAILRYLGSSAAQKAAVAWGGWGAFLSAWALYLKPPAVGVEPPIYGLAIGNARVLRRRIADYAAQGNIALVSNKIGNQNTAKLTDQIKLYLRLLYRRHNRLAFTDILRLLEAKVAQMGWEYKPITADTVANYLKQPDVKMACATERYDKREWERLFHVTVKRSAPTHPHDLWVMDGTPIELYWWDGKKFRRESVFLVIDASTWAVLGWCFGTESKETILLALRHAYRRSGVMPLQLQLDHSSGAWNAAMIAWYKQTIQYVTPAQVGNAKAKVVEAWFSHFHLRVLKVHFDGFAGMNVTAKNPDNRSHYEWLKANRSKLPQSREACIAQIEQAFGIWNQQHKVAIGKTAPQTPHSRLQAVPHRARLLCLEEEMSLFWLWRMDGDEVKQYTYGQSGIRFDLHQTRYEYRVYNADGQTDIDFWTNHAGGKFKVKYDPDDMSMIALYDKDERFVTLAQTTIEAPMAIADYVAGSGRFVQGEINQRRAILERAQAAIHADNEALHAAGLGNEVPTTMPSGGNRKRTAKIAPTTTTDPDTSPDAAVRYKTAFTLREVKDELNEAEDDLKQPERRGGLYRVEQGSLEVVG